LMSALM